MSSTSLTLKLSRLDIYKQLRKMIIINYLVNYENLYNTNDVYITTFEAYVSTGYYIRQFISDFGEKTGLLGTALNINRIKIHIN